MSWFAAADEIALAVAWTFLPGLLVGRALGLRGSWPLFGAAPISLGVLALWPIVLAPLGIPWNRLSALVCVLVTAALAAVVGLVVRRRSRVADEERARFGPGLWWTVAGVAAASMVGALAVLRGIGEPDLPAQTWDTVFHLNAVRLAIDTGNASSLYLGIVANPAGGATIYPAAWHSVVALTTTSSIVVASNAVSLVIAALVWPLALAAAARALFPTWPWLGLTVPLAGSAFSAFPASLLAIGVLWPNALGYALVWPTVALTFLCARRVCDAAHSHGHWAPYAVAVVLCGIGVALSQPNAALVYAIIVTPMLVPELVRIRRALPGRRRVLPAVFAVLWLLFWAAAFAASAWHIPVWERGVTDSFLRGVAWAVGDGALGTGDWSIVLALLTLVGAAAAAVKRRWGFLVALVLLLVLAGLSVSQTWPEVLRPWYGEQLRLLAAAAVAVAVAAGVGMAVPAALIARWVRDDRWRRVVASATVLAVAAATFAATGALRQRGREAPLRWYHQEALTNTDYFFSRDELALVERLDEVLPDGSLVLGDPFSGSSLLWAISDVPVVFPHMRGGWTADARFLARHFRDIGTDPEVCAAVNRLGVTHLYVDRYVFWPDNIAHDLYTGIPRYAPTPTGFTLVDSGGTARVYRIDECG